MTDRTTHQPLLEEQYIDKHEAARLFSVSPHTLKTYRQKHWQEGIHFQYLSSRAIRYHKELLVDWYANRSFPEAHQRAIEIYLASLLSNQTKKRTHKRK